MKFSALVHRVEGKGSAAWEIHSAAVAAKRAGEDIVLLSVGDPDASTPGPVVDSAIEALKGGDTHYTDIAGRPELRSGVAGLYQRRFGLNTTAENVIVVAGAQNGLFACASCLLNEGDEVLVPEPMYVTYVATLEAGGAKVVPVPCPPENGFQLNVAALRERVNSRTKAIFFANPNNPTGVVMDREILQGIAAVACENDLWVVVDEVYDSLIFDGEHYSIASIPGMSPRTVSIGSLSKSHAMTGWRIGWCVADAQLITHMERLALAMTYGIPGFVQAAAEKALALYDTTTVEMRELYRRRRDLVLERLADCPLLRVSAPSSGMFILLDIRASGLDSASFAWRLLREAKVSVLDAAAFGSSAAGFVRLSFANSEADLAKACDRLQIFMRTIERQLNLLPARTIVFPSASPPVLATEGRISRKIEVDKVHKRFGNAAVLKGVSLVAHQGDIISLIGASGSGKSTLLRCINLLEVPDEGNIYVNGEGVAMSRNRHGNPVVSDPAQLRRVRAKLAMVFQNFNLWPHRTVLENLMEAPVHVFGVKRADAARKAEAMLERVGLAHKRNDYPVSLSGGQQQRVAIARALAVDPDVMLFDEPTSALDPELVSEVLKVIRSLAEDGRTMILVTHEMAFARDVSNRVVFLHDGIVEEEGPPHQVFTQPRSERCGQFVNAHRNR